MRKQLKDNPLKNAVNRFFQVGWYHPHHVYFYVVHVIFRKLTFWKLAGSSKEKRHSCVGYYSQKFYVAKFKTYLIYIHWNKIYLHIITFIYILHLKSNLLNWRLNHNFIVKPVDVTQSFISSGQVSRFSFCCISQSCGPKK